MSTTPGKKAVASPNATPAETLATKLEVALEPSAVDKAAKPVPKLTSDHEHSQPAKPVIDHDMVEETYKLPPNYTRSRLRQRHHLTTNRHS